MTQKIDILMITCNRPRYTSLSLPALLQSCDDSMRIWLWHNGGDDATWSIIESHASHSSIARVHRSAVNGPLSEPTNWLWKNSDSPLVGKVDDDIIVPADWAQRLRQVHAAVRRAGVLSAWTFPETDFDPSLAKHKCQRFHGCSIMRNAWVGGGCYVMKRTCFEQHRLLQQGESFADWCRALAWQRWIHGWPQPLIVADHMDDPRSPHTEMHGDAIPERALPLTALRNGITTTAQWQTLLADVARTVQACPATPGRFYQVRSMMRSLSRGLRRAA